MAVHIAWEDERKRVLHYRLDNNWTWDEFFAAKKQANELMDMVSHPLGVIIEAPPSPILPPNIIGNARKALRSTHPNTVVIVIVAAHPLIRTMFHTTRALGRLANFRVELASTPDEARTIIDARLRPHDSAKRR
jgi:hypothetical protein